MDVTETVDSQDAIADSLASPDNAVPISDAQAQLSEGGDGNETLTEEVAGPESEPTEEVETEEADDYLPTEQEKVFPQDVLAKYAKRYGYTPDEVEGDPRIAQLVHDKINTDIYLNSLRNEKQETKESETKEQVRPTEPVTMEQHLEGLKQWAKTNTDPRVAQQFANSFLDAFDVKDDKGNPIQATPEMANKLTTTIATYGLNLLQTAMPQMIMPVLEQTLPGFGDMYYRAARATSWDSVRNSDQQYAGLPAYGSQEFVAMCERVREANPLLDRMGDTLAAQNGGQLIGKAAEEFYGMLARTAVGTKVTSSEIKTALEKGKRTAVVQAQRKGLGNLGAGQSKGRIASDGSNGDPLRDLFGEGLDEYSKQHGNI